MKNLFIFLNIILFVCAVFLFMLHFSYTSPPPEKILKQTPVQSNISVPAVFKKKNQNLSTTQIALISGNDLFSPERGIDPSTLKVEKTGKEIKHSQLELTGIFKMGPVKGAIISSKVGRSANANKAKVYTVGKKIGDTSYTLQDIDPENESVVVSLGTTQYVLKLEREDADSLNRRNKGAAASKARALMSQPEIETNPPPLPPQPPTASTAAGKPKTAPAKPTQTIPPANNKKDMKKIREEILKKMMERRKKNKK